MPCHFPHAPEQVKVPPADSVLALSAVPPGSAAARPVAVGCWPLSPWSSVPAAPSAAAWLLTGQRTALTVRE